MLEVDPRWPRRRLQHDVPHRARGHPLQVPQGEPVDPVRGPRQPARSRGLRRAAVPGRRHADRPDRLRDLLRLAVPRGDPPAAANGAEVLVRVSAYMDPWGATEPMNWWTIVNRCRALENTAYVVAANQGASLRHYPPYSWPGGSQIVDFDGRHARRGVTRSRRADRRRRRSTSRALRHERATRRGHHMLAHLRTEAYPVYAAHRYPPGMHPGAPRVDLSYERNVELIEEARARLDAAPLVTPRHDRSCEARSSRSRDRRLRLENAGIIEASCSYYEQARCSLALGSIGAQAPPAPAPYTVLSAEGRRPLATRLISGQEMFALDDLAKLFELTRARRHVWPAA